MRLEIVNDGARPATGRQRASAAAPTTPYRAGRLAGRARAVGGTAAGATSGDGTFRLRIELPEDAR